MTAIGTTVSASRPLVIPPLDPAFRPAALFNRAFREAVRAAGGGTSLRVGLERPGGAVSTFVTRVGRFGQGVAL